MCCARYWLPLLPPLVALTTARVAAPNVVSSAGDIPKGRHLCATQTLCIINKYYKVKGNLQLCHLYHMTLQMFTKHSHPCLQSMPTVITSVYYTFAYT